MTTAQELLQEHYAALRRLISSISPGDEAALRSLERKYEQLDEALFFHDVELRQAMIELDIECYDCFPVDE